MLPAVRRPRGGVAWAWVLRRLLASTALPLHLPLPLPLPLALALALALVVAVGCSTWTAYQWGRLLQPLPATPGPPVLPALALD